MGQAGWRCGFQPAARTNLASRCLPTRAPSMSRSTGRDCSARMSRAVSCPRWRPARSRSRPREHSRIPRSARQSCAFTGTRPLRSRRRSKPRTPANDPNPNNAFPTQLQLVKRTLLRLINLAAGIAMVAALGFVRADEPAAAGPQTESRFPPLQVPAGFKATLFACDPLIEYPSVIAAGPRPGAVFVAVDYMTGLGTEIVRRSEVRLVEDSSGDGYADQAPM